MNKYANFKPTWLYIKKHIDTGLMYFGKTVSDNPSKYKGSGVHWLSHLQKHGNNVTTIWCHLFTDKDELFEEATAFSRSHDIVNSRDWANHQIETGLGINIQRAKAIFSPARREKYRIMMLGNTINKGRVQSDAERKVRAESLCNAYQSGSRVVTDKMREAAKRTHTGKIVTADTRLKQSQSAILSKSWRIGKTNEEIYGKEMADEIRRKKSMLPPPNSKPITINETTYESIKAAATALNTTEYKAKKLSGN